MNNRRAFLVAIALQLAFAGACFFVGHLVSQQRQRVALLHATQRSDSLQGVVDSAARALQVGSVRVDSVLATWSQFRDSVRSVPRPVRYLAGRVDTIPGPLRVDTVSVEVIVAKADSAIATVEQARRQCLSAFGTCTAALTAVTNRAERAEADAALLRAADGRRARWRNVTLGVCGGSVAYNAWTVWGRR